MYKTLFIKILTTIQCPNVVDNERTTSISSCVTVIFLCTDSTQSPLSRF